MTTNKTLWQLARLCLCTWVACTPIACSEMEDDTPPPPGSEVEASSDISFSIVDADGKEIGREVLGNSTYPASKTIIRIGTGT